VGKEPGFMTTETHGRATLAPRAVIALVGVLVAIYIVSQFLRSSVAVIAPNLAAELDLNAVEIGFLSSIFFFVFAAMQLPLGIAIDRFGPRTCLLVCAAVTVLGEVLFAAAQSTSGLIAARALLGAGTCASLMAPLAIYARRFSPERFATLTGLQIGCGSIGGLLATAPLAFAAATIGWRASFLVLAAITAAIALLVALVIRDEPLGPGATRRRETLAESVAGLIAVFRVRSVGALLLINLSSYASYALVVGLWGGPYLAHVYGYGLTERGDVLFLAAIAQIAGSLAWGPTDRLLGSHKTPVLLGAGVTVAALGVIAFVGTLGPVLLVVWFCLLGFASAYTPVMIAHGKSLFPPHLVGRGITVMNMATMGGVFVAQAVSGAVIQLFPAIDGIYPLTAYQVVFGLQALFLASSWLVYRGAWDPASAGNAGSEHRVRP
jgi:MFS family permease